MPSRRISKKTGIQMVCVNAEMTPEDYEFLIGWALRRGLNGAGRNTGVSRLIGFEIRKVIAAERKGYQHSHFHQSDSLVLETAGRG